MYIDADIIYALLKPNDRHLEFALEIIELKENMYTSSTTFVELGLLTKRELSDHTSKNILNLVLEKIPALKVASFDKKTLEKSLELRQVLGLGIFDSIHAATAILIDKKIASTDHIFDEVKGLKRIKPKQ